MVGGQREGGQLKCEWGKGSLVNIPEQYMHIDQGVATHQILSIPNREQMCLLLFLAVLSLHEFWLLGYIMNVREEKKLGDRVSERGFGFSKEFCQISRGMKPRTQVWVLCVWLWLKGTVTELGSRGWNPVSWKRSKDIQRNWEDIEQTGVSLQIRKLLFFF